MEENKIVIENGIPKVVLSEETNKVGGVSIQEGIILAKQLAHKIIESKMNSNGINIAGSNQ